MVVGHLGSVQTAVDHLGRATAVNHLSCHSHLSRWGLLRGPSHLAPYLPPYFSSGVSLQKVVVTIWGQSPGETWDLSVSERVARTGSWEGLPRAEGGRGLLGTCCWPQGKQTPQDAKGDGCHLPVLTAGGQLRAPALPLG